MKLYSEGTSYQLFQGNMLDMEEYILPDSISSIVCDPPYELNFMGKGWDNSGIAFQKETWEKCLQVLKPGGYLLAFGGSRTFHRIACAIEDAGFEIRDTIMWLYGSGFPKSMNIGLSIDKKNGVKSPIIGQNQDILTKQAKDFREGKRKITDSLNSGAPERNNGFKTVSADIRQAQNEWNGWGTALKPSYEPIIVARKPCRGSCIDNVLKYGVGGINIGECRIPHNEPVKTTNRFPKSGSVFNMNTSGYDNTKNHFASADENGRFPSNTIFTYDETDFEEVCGGLPSTKQNGSITKQYEMKNQVYGKYGKCNTFQAYSDSGSAARYFYCAKASKKDRDEGLDIFDTKQCVGGGGGIGNYKKDVNSTSGKFGSEKAPHKNIHPTVKPTELMQYLIRLVTPDNGTVLDPFNGSGSTGKAVMYENKERDKNYKYIGIELTEEYLPIADARIRYAQNSPVERKMEKKNRPIRNQKTNQNMHGNE